MLDYVMESGENKVGYLRSMYIAMEDADELVAPQPDSPFHQWSIKLIELAWFQWVSNILLFFAFTFPTLDTFLDDMREPRRGKIPVIGTMPYLGCQKHL